MRYQVVEGDENEAGLTIRKQRPPLEAGKRSDRVDNRICNHVVLYLPRISLNRYRLR